MAIMISSPSPARPTSLRQFPPPDLSCCGTAGISPISNAQTRFARYSARSCRTLTRPSREGETMSATMPVPEQDAAFERLLAYAATEMGRLHVPGVAIGVLHEGKAYTGGLGVTSVEHPLPVDAQTLFLVGSIGKTMTTLAVMRLVEQGQLDLETPIRAYLPDLRLQDAE